jgi:hypothetical protein
MRAFGAMAGRQLSCGEPDLAACGTAGQTHESRAVT